MSSGPNIPRSQRRRKPIEITLSDVARAQLEIWSASEAISRSAMIERMILGWVRVRSQS